MLYLKSCPQKVGLQLSWIELSLHTATWHKKIPVGKNEISETQLARPPIWTCGKFYKSIHLRNRGNEETLSWVVWLIFCQLLVGVKEDFLLENLIVIRDGNVWWNLKEVRKINAGLFWVCSRFRSFLALYFVYMHWNWILSRFLSFLSL